MQIESIMGNLKTNVGNGTKRNGEIFAKYILGSSNESKDNGTNGEELTIKCRHLILKVPKMDKGHRL